MLKQLVRDKAVPCRQRLSGEAGVQVPALADTESPGNPSGLMTALGTALGTSPPHAGVKERHANGAGSSMWCNAVPGKGTNSTGKTSQAPALLG